MRDRRTVLVTVWLVLQALTVLAWWIALWWSPAARAPFVVGDWPEATLWAFAVPDLCWIVGGSAAAAHGFWHGNAWARTVLLLVAGGVFYATLWCLGANLATGGKGLLGTALMLASAAGTAACVQVTRR